SGYWSRDMDAVAIAKFWLNKKESKWWCNPLLIGITSAIVGAIVSAVIIGRISMHNVKLEHQDRIKEISILQEILKDKSSELTKSNNERDRLKAEIREAFDSGDPSKITSVFDKINRQK
ncbi:hypothetical protein ACFL2G_05290, partial [Candidatus Omnitrophota bacterium]